jgi:ATP-dependent Clp protease adaptor protein ClpS
MLQLLLGYTPEEAFRMAQEADRTGRVVVCTAPLPRAERVKEQIEANGPDLVLPHCRGSMRVALEPVG